MVHSSSPGHPSFSCPLLTSSGFLLTRWSPSQLSSLVPSYPVSIPDQQDTHSGCPDLSSPLELIPGLQVHPLVSRTHLSCSEPNPAIQNPPQLFRTHPRYPEPFPAVHNPPQVPITHPRYPEPTPAVQNPPQLSRAHPSCPSPTPAL